MMIKGKAARQKGIKKETSTLSHFFQKKSIMTPVKSEPVEMCMELPGKIKLESVEETAMVKEEKMDISAFPSTSQSIKPAVKGN